MTHASDTVSYGPDGRPRRSCASSATSAASGCSTSGAARAPSRIALAQQGAVVIARRHVDRDRLAQARSRADAAEVRVEWHDGDLADLAFLRADSIDVAFSAVRAWPRSTTSPACSARCSACSSRTRRSCSRYEHPMSLCIGATDEPASCASLLLRPGPDRRRARRRARSGLRAATIGDVFTELAPRRASASTPCSSPTPPTTPARASRRPSSGAPARKAPERRTLRRPSRARCRARAPRRRGARRPRPRRSGPRRGGPRAGSRAPRRRPGPGATPRNSIT